ncbi:MAG TPA: aminotransferase class IV, partial [Phototrophicaceae bacterium]|nr:aminotransferase class IV [Phototrophicaceae bacterium]
LIRKLTPAGLQPVDYSAESLSEAAQFESHDGVYTVTNTYHVTQVLMFDAHLDRLEDSARRAEIPLHLDRQRLRSSLREMILLANYGDVRFRVTVPRDVPNTFILSIEPYTPPSSVLIEHGVRVITSAGGARSNPAAKTTDWMHDRQQLADAMQSGIYDTILLDTAGNLLEGLGANFYAILSDELRTAGEHVLPGIAQKIVFIVAPKILPVVKTAVNINDLPRISEAFITSSSRGVIPVIEIDGMTLSDGQPGEKTRAIRTAYDQWATIHLEEL